MSTPERTPLLTHLYQMGKRLYGFMEDPRRMLDRVPHYGEEWEYRDICGCCVENFDYPINLMFASSMPIYGGGFEEALSQAVADLKRARMPK